MEAIRDLYLSEQSPKEGGSLGSVDKALSESIPVLPKAIKVLIKESFSLGSFEPEVSVDDFLRDSSGALLGQVEVTVWFAVGVAFQGVSANQ